MSDIYTDLMNAQLRRVAPPQNWVSRATDEIERLRAANGKMVDPLTDHQIATLQSYAPPDVLFLRPSIVRWIARAIEEAHGIKAKKGAA